MNATSYENKVSWRASKQVQHNYPKGLKGLEHRMWGSESIYQKQWFKHESWYKIVILNFFLEQKDDTILQKDLNWMKTVVNL